MTNIRKIFRWGILALQLVAMIIFFVLPVILGSDVLLTWYIFGILQTLIFCVTYFRMAKKRRVVSIILMVINTLFALFLLLINSIMANFGDWGTTAIIYCVCIMLAVFLSLFVPEKVQSLD